MHGQNNLEIKIEFNQKIITPNGVGIAKEKYIEDDGSEYRLVCHLRANFENNGIGKPLAPEWESHTGKMLFWLYRHEDLE